MKGLNPIAIIYVRKKNHDEGHTGSKKKKETQNACMQTFREIKGIFTAERSLAEVRSCCTLLLCMRVVHAWCTQVCL